MAQEPGASFRVRNFLSPKEAEPTVRFHVGLASINHQSLCNGRSHFGHRPDGIWGILVVEMWTRCIMEAPLSMPRCEAAIKSR